MGAHGRIILVLGEPTLQISDRCFCELDLVDNAFRADVGAAVARVDGNGIGRALMGRRGRGQSGALPGGAALRPGGLGSGRLAQHGQQHDGQRQAGKPQCDKPPAALLAAARRRTCAAHGARAGHGRISVRPRLLHAGRSLSPALGRDTHVRRMPCGTARTASLVDISVLRLHAHPPFFAIF